MKKLCVFLDNGHGNNTKGKCSPDKTVLEYAWCREIVSRIYKDLTALNIPVIIITPELTDISLAERVNRINKYYAEMKAKGYQCLLISVHINAAGSGDKWHNASGWTVWISKNASKNSKRFAQISYDNASKAGLKGNRWVPVGKYWEANYKILKDSYCPAVLTENLFQDNKGDVKILLSEEGKAKIVKIHVDSILQYIKE
jgi:N-acetylmuramoyl-L-alanine amidase